MACKLPYSIDKSVDDLSEVAVGENGPGGAAMAQCIGFRCQCSGFRNYHLKFLTPET